jgi:hypothetical protein
MFAIAAWMFSFFGMSIFALRLARKLDKVEAELKIALAELAKYRRPHDSRGRFTK